jgi:hypothetical protein
VLRSDGWSPGDAWLGYRVHEGSLQQVAAFRPRGVPGFVYWKLLGPFHRIVFKQMIRHRLRRASDSMASHSLAFRRSQVVLGVRESRIEVRFHRSTLNIVV